MTTKRPKLGPNEGAVGAWEAWAVSQGVNMGRLYPLVMSAKTVARMLDEASVADPPWNPTSLANLAASYHVALVDLDRAVPSGNDVIDDLIASMRED